MQSKRILLFGGSGQIGQALQKQSHPAEWHLGVCDRADCDLTDAGALARVIRAFEPDIIINAAALTDIDTCEQNPDLARKVNFEAVANIAAHGEAFNAPLIQISTDYVFDGTDGHTPYATDAMMNPINIYGESKMMGEEAARHALHWHVILRTSLVFSAYGQNILTKTLHQIDHQETITAVTDQIANPTSADTVAEALVTISNAILNGKVDGFGTYHLSGEPAVSRADFIQAIIDTYAPYSGRRPALAHVRAADCVGRVQRPAYSALSHEKIERVYGIKPRAWREDLAIAIQKLMENRA